MLLVLYCLLVISHQRLRIPSWHGECSEKPNHNDAQPQRHQAGTGKIGSNGPSRIPAQCLSSGGGYTTSTRVPRGNPGYPRLVGLPRHDVKTWHNSLVHVPSKIFSSPQYTSWPVAICSTSTLMSPQTHVTPSGGSSWYLYCIYIYTVYTCNAITQWFPLTPEYGNNWNST